MIAILNGGIYRGTRVLWPGRRRDAHPPSSESDYVTMAWAVRYLGQLFHGGELTDYQAKVKCCRGRLAWPLWLTASSSTPACSWGWVRERIETAS